MRSASRQQIKDQLCDLKCKQRRDRISDLFVLFGSRPFEQVVVWKCLNSSRFSDSKTSRLSGIGMDEVMAIFRNVRRDCRRHLFGQLNTKAVGKNRVRYVPLYVLMVRQQLRRKVAQFEG